MKLKFRPSSHSEDNTAIAPANNGETKQKAIKCALEMVDKAITFRGRVGACLYTKTGKLFPGFNIETHIHKGYHAEEVAIINGLLAGTKPEEFEGIVIFCKLEGSGVFPACASCRQFLWEFTNPQLLVTVIDSTGIILYESDLATLYPKPYPEK